MAILRDTTIEGSLIVNNNLSVGGFTLKEGNIEVFPMNKIQASDLEASDIFGNSVAISGDYAIVGAPYEDTGGSSAGAAYIFRRTDTNTWDAGVKIQASVPHANDFFGRSVAISGDYAIVGAYLEDAGGTWDAGAAYIFRRTDTNTWDAGTKIMASDKQAGDYFGISVAISGDYAIVGAPWEDPGGITDAGSAYFYRICKYLTIVS